VPKGTAAVITCKLKVAVVSALLSKVTTGEMFAEEVVIEDERSPSAVKVTPNPDEPTSIGNEFRLGQSFDLVTVTTTVSALEVGAIIRVLTSVENGARVSPPADTGRGAKRETEVSRIVIRNRDAMCREWFL